MLGDTGPRLPPIVCGQILGQIVRPEPLNAAVDELDLRGGHLVEHPLEEADEPGEVRRQADDEDAGGVVGVQVQSSIKRITVCDSNRCIFRLWRSRDPKRIAINSLKHCLHSVGAV